MKILNIIQRYPPAVGGSETWCQEVCRYLAKKGHDTTVLTLNINREEEFWREPPDNEHTIALGRLAYDEGVIVRRYRRSLPVYSFYHLILKSIIDYKFKIYFYGPHSIEMYGKMWREVKQADIVFLYTLPYPHNYIGLALAKLFNKKTLIVPFFHPSHPHYERKSNYWLMKKCDAVLTVSEFEKQYLGSQGIPFHKLHVTGVAIHPEQYRAMDLEPFREQLQTQYKIKPDEKIIIFIGRKTREKGVAHLIEAVQGLYKEMPMKLFLLGPRLGWYEDYYAQLSPEDKTHIIDLGVLSHQEKVNLLHLSHLLILPSQYESFGIVFLEAWICGVPVMGTAEGAIPGIIGDDGFVCKYGNVSDLRSKIAEALANYDNLKSKGMSGREKVLQQYTWEIIGRKAEQAVNMAYES